ncbi:MAG: hypothetical protein AAF547_04820 [Actinomycetota bacterium]
MTMISDPGTTPSSSGALGPDRPMGTVVEELRSRIRDLWHQAPSAREGERESVVVELMDLDLELERLALRARQHRIGDEERASLADCTSRLGALGRHWPAVS